jgi:serine/threonine-protein kinase HipA
VYSRLENLLPLHLTREEQLREARLRADKMSIQGVQPKLSAMIKPKEDRFEIVDRGGQFILKPNPPPFEEVPANDGSWVYFVRRFDRAGRNQRLHQEDFAQLTGAARDTKYNSSLEQITRVVETHCTFPAVEKAKLACLLLFCFLTGNEDMHLMNFSLVVRNGVVCLSPAYDLLNTTLVLGNASEESALPMRGKKRTLTGIDWVDYLCRDRLGLPTAILDPILHTLDASRDGCVLKIENSCLPAPGKADYLKILKDRRSRLFG